MDAIYSKTRPFISQNSASSHIDSRWFNQLFSPSSGFRARNRSQICRGIALIARGAAGRVDFPNAEERREAAAAATLHCLERLDKFRTSHARANAIGYFTRMAHRAINAHKRSEARRAVHQRILNTMYV